MSSASLPSPVDGLGSLPSALLALALLVGGFLVWRVGSPSSYSFVLWSILCVPCVLFALKFDYLNPLLVFLLPWFVVTMFASMEISRYARPLNAKTYTVLWAMELAAVASYFLAVYTKTTGQGARRSAVVKQQRYWMLLAFYLVLTILNVAAAGYVPLIRGILTGDSGYLDFGIHSIYGFYNAFSSSLAVLSFYLYLRTRRKSYLIVYILIYAVFLLFVTRGFIISVLVQSLVVYSFVQHRIKMRTVAIGGAVVLALFSVAGNLRSGSIKEIAGIEEQFENVPDPLIWTYAYSYFNVLNLDNVISNPRLPAYDASSILSLLPSFIRPESSHIDEEIELSQFNAYSYLAPVYADMGIWGSVVFTFAVTWWGARSYQKAIRHRSFYSVAKYSVLFFCALFSFFVNFWFSLPLIFEIPILAGMSDFVADQGRTHL
jgi:oligosaccharide repeat unit polymerase